MTREEAGALPWEPIQRPAPLFFQSFFAGSGLLIAWLLSQHIAWAAGLVVFSWCVCRWVKVPARWLWGIGIFGVFLVYGHVTYHVVPENDLRRIDAPLPRAVELKLIPLEEPSWKPGAYGTLSGNAVCRVEAVNLGEGWMPAQGEVWARLKGNPQPDSKQEATRFYGNEAIAGGYLEVPQPPESPGQFDFSQYLKSSGVNHLFTAHLQDWQPTGEFKGWLILKWANQLREYMLGVLQLGLDPASPWPSLMAGMLFGYRDGISTEMMNEFTITGTLHLFAVSGQNVGMILWVFLIFLRSFGLIKWRWGWLVAPGLVMFCLSTGLESSASRALVMIILVLAGWIAYRPVTPLNLLGAAALILWAWDPWQLLDVGFQLSFMVLLALLLVTGAVARWIYRPLRPDVFIPRGRLPSWRRYVDECTAKSCMIFSASGVAWLASLPLILYHFGLVSPITTISNCLVVPLAGTVVVLALMSVLCSVFFDPLAIVFNIINAKILMVMTAVISMLAAVPYGHFYVSQDNGLDGDTFKLTVLSCERSAPAILETQDVAMLFGAGSLREWEYRVNPARKFLGIESLNQVVVMQSNSRYLGGLSELLSTVPVEEIIMPPYPTSSSTYRKWVAALDENPGIAARVVQPVAGQSLIMDEQISGRVLWPPGKVKAWRGTAENSGLSIYLDLPGGGVLLSGNPGQKVEDQMVLPSDLPAVKVMIQGSHSREPNLAPGWLKKIQPEVIVRPASGFYPEADISWEKRNQLKRMSTELIEMGRTGPIQIRGSKDGLRILFWDKYQKEFKE